MKLNPYQIVQLSTLAILMAGAISLGHMWVISVGAIAVLNLAFALLH